MNAETTQVDTSVLIVDDDPESLLLVSTMVEYIGYKPIVAQDFDAALAQVRQHPAAIVLDLRTPDQTTERLTELLIREGSKLPVVLMSALTNSQLGVEALSYSRRGLNVVAMLAKPFWVDVLITAMENAIPNVHVAAIADT